MFIFTFELTLSCPNQASSQIANCDSSYPDICIESPPPDLNCDDISVYDIRVLSPDPHGFDRDGDGVGCESGNP
jgi:micrococcal nuclease